MLPPSLLQFKLLLIGENRFVNRDIKVIKEYGVFYVCTI